MCKKNIKQIILSIVLTAFSMYVSKGFCEEKKLFKGRYLKLEGGFSIPLLNELGAPNMSYSNFSLDRLPGTNRWAMAHPAGYVVELLEPGNFGTGDSETWPELLPGRSEKVFENLDKINPQGVFWLDENTILTSGRKAYRDGFVNGWIASINLSNSQETAYTVTAVSNTEADNFHVLQALGGGFMRITDAEFSAKVANSNEFLLGRGGYDVLGSPLGPALASWNLGDQHAKFVLDFPKEFPGRRDPYYTYPSLDPNTYEKVQLPMWKDPDSIDGFWQAGDVGGIAFINHALVKGVVVTTNHARGILDYRAQGDGGSGKYFSVQKPSIFYSELSDGGNRSDHESETENSKYPDGTYARVGLIIDPLDLIKVSAGEIAPWEVTYTRFEWPRGPFNWSEDPKKHTALGGVYWDNDRQLLWVALSWPKPLLVAYSIVVDDTRADETPILPLGLYNNAATSVVNNVEDSSKPKAPISMTLDLK